MNIKYTAIVLTVLSTLCLSQVSTAEITLQEAKEKIAQLEDENQSLKEKIKTFEQEVAEVREKIEQHEIKDLKNTEMTN